MHPILGRQISNILPKYPERVTLKGNYTRIEPLDAQKYYEGMYQRTRNHKLWDYLFDGPYDSLEEYRVALKKREQDPTRMSYLVFEIDGVEPLGIFSLMRIDLVHRSLQIGSILFTQKLQKTRIATQVLFLSAKYVFQELKFVRYQWKCNARNIPSRQAALRFGFSYQGQFKYHMIVKGHLRDTAWFSMVDEEWPEIKKEYQRWLSQSNFDENKQQKTKLSIKIQRKA